MTNPILNEPTANAHSRQHTQPQLREVKKAKPCQQHVVKSFLDQNFPLDGGSHQEVASYYVYYCNLMVCFKDGRLSGLQKPSQFVALGGHKDSPEALVFKNDTGSHLELTLGKRRGADGLVTISDLQLETQTTLSADNLGGVRYWVSLMENNNQGAPIAHLEDKEYRSKRDEDYQLGRFV
jgi:malate synthase